MCRYYQVKYSYCQEIDGVEFRACPNPTTTCLLLITFTVDFWCPVCWLDPELSDEGLLAPEFHPGPEGMDQEATLVRTMEVLDANQDLFPTNDFLIFANIWHDIDHNRLLWVLIHVQRQLSSKLFSNGRLPAPTHQERLLLLKLGRAEVAYQVAQREEKLDHNLGHRINLFSMPTVLESMPIEDRTCPVCLIPFGNPGTRPVTTTCGHTFCHECLFQTLKAGSNACPMCRNPIPTKQQLDVEASGGESLAIRRINLLVDSIADRVPAGQIPPPRA